MPLMRGARPSPRHKLAAAEPHKIKGAPPQYANVPTHLSMWGNNQYGDCVTAEEAFAKVAAPPGVFISEADVISWAGAHDWLNGANLTEVMDAMIQKGLPANGQTCQDGPYKSVDWTNRAVLCDAIYQGPVKIAIAADQLSGTEAGNKNGWFATGFRTDHNSDHCVSLPGYGPLGYLFQSLGVPTPQNADPNGFGYLMFTWNTIGVIDEKSMIAITDEAWLRNPTTAGYTPPTPPVPPVPPVPPGPDHPPLDVTLTGTVGGFLPVKLHGVAVPMPSGSGFQFRANGIRIDGNTFDYGAGVAPLPIIFADVMAIVGDVVTKNFVALFADVQKLLADLRQHQASLPPLMPIIGDVLAILGDFRAKNWTALIADIQKLLTDLGLNL